MSAIKKPIDQQVVVITGASSGIGLATACLAVDRGASVVLAARTGDELARLADEFNARGGRATYAIADVGKRDEVEAIAAKAIATFGRFDTWVNVAGVTIYGNLWDVSDADSERLIQTNLWGTIFGSLVAVAELRRKGGALINVGSVASDLAFPQQGMYCASKHAIKGFTDALRMELLQDGSPLSVTLIKPTSIDSPLPQRARNYMDREPQLPPPVYRPAEVAHAILHAAVHPRRDIYVGGAGKAFSSFNALAPSLYDALAPLITSLERRTDKPRDPAGALHAPARAGQTRGSHPGYVMRTSTYTRASLHPLATAGLMTFGIVGALAALLRPGQDGRGHRG